MKDDLDRLVDIVFGGGALKHECENCGDTMMAAADSLPPGWMVVAATSDKLFRNLDDVDSKSLIVCAICFGLASRVLKGLPTRAVQKAE